MANEEYSELEKDENLKGQRPVYLDGGIREYDGYRGEPIFVAPKNDFVYYNEAVYSQVVVPATQTLQELREELGLNQDFFEQGVTRTLELPK